MPTTLDVERLGLQHVRNTLCDTCQWPIAIYRKQGSRRYLAADEVNTADGLVKHVCRTPSAAAAPADDVHRCSYSFGGKRCPLPGTNSNSTHGDGRLFCGACLVRTQPDREEWSRWIEGGATAWFYANRPESEINAEIDRRAAALDAVKQIRREAFPEASPGRWIYTHRQRNPTMPFGDWLDLLRKEAGAR